VHEQFDDIYDGEHRPTEQELSFGHVFHTLYVPPMPELDIDLWTPSSESTRIAYSLLSLSLENQKRAAKTDLRISW
jgi:hypothetical protein